VIKEFISCDRTITIIKMVELLVPEELESDDLYQQLEDEGIGYTEVSRDEYLEELVSGDYDAVIGDNHERMYAAAIEYEETIPVFDYGSSGLATSFLSSNSKADASSIAEIVNTYKKQSFLDNEVRIGSSMLRHDALNEINVIRGRLDLAKRAAENEEVTDHVQIAENASRSMEEILESSHALFTTSEEKERVSLEKILDKIEEQYRYEADERGFDLEIDPNFRTYACAGREVMQMYCQMVRNGIEHSEGDQIRVRMREENGKPVVEYEDDGEGFDMDAERLLQRGVSQNSEGGLGMFIMAQTAERYDIDMEIGESEELGGAKITTILEPAEE